MLVRILQIMTDVVVSGLWVCVHQLLAFGSFFSLCMSDTILRSRFRPDNTKPNLFTGEYYGKENGWKPTVLNPASVPRHELPRWRVPMGDGPNPAGPTGTYGDYIMVQVRPYKILSKLSFRYSA